MGAGRPSKRRRIEKSAPEVREQSSPFLRIPPELRLQIYGYALSDVTITVAEQQRNVFDSAEDGDDGEINGVPSRYLPLVKNEYDLELVKIGRSTLMPHNEGVLGQQHEQPQICGSINSAGASMASMDSGYASAGSSMYSIATTSTTSLPHLEVSRSAAAVPSITNLALLKVNKQIRNELLAHMQSRTCKEITTHVTYPYGLLVLRQHYPALLKYTKNIVITGQYFCDEECSSAPSQCTSEIDRTQIFAADALRSLTRTIYGSCRDSNPADYYSTMPKMQMRIFFPQQRCYSQMWKDEDGPVVAALACIPTGSIEVKTWRGRTGNGVTMKVEPPKPEQQDQWRRNLSSVFRILKCWRARGLRPPTRRDTLKAEDFWEESFADEKMFEAALPETTCWNR